MYSLYSSLQLSVRLQLATLSYSKQDDATCSTMTVSSTTIDMLRRRSSSNQTVENGLDARIAKLVRRNSRDNVDNIMPYQEFHDKW